MNTSKSKGRKASSAGKVDASRTKGSVRSTKLAAASGKQKFLSLANLAPNPRSRRPKKRVGFGESSGHGKTSSRGGKGQTARKSGHVRVGFEGGQMPLYRRLPKYGFVSRAKVLGRNSYALVNLNSIELRFESGETVSLETLLSKGVLKRLGKNCGVKLLGNGALTKKLSFVVQAASEGARKQVEAAGGSLDIKPLSGSQIRKRSARSIAGQSIAEEKHC